MDVSRFDPQAPLPDWAVVASAIFIALLMLSFWGLRRMIERSMRPPKENDKDEKSE